MLKRTKLPTPQLLQLKNGLMMTADSELEIWRAETLYSKEPETIAWIDYYARGGGVFYDVGANVGIYSLYAAHLNRDLDVYSFEPVAANYLSLLKNKVINKLSNLNPFQLALSSNNSLNAIYLSDERVGNSGAQIFAPINEHGQTFDPLAKERILCLSLDNMVENYAFPNPSFIKIDVDGHELDILTGASKTLADPKLQSILIECNGDENKRLIELALLDKGFALNDYFNKILGHSSDRRKERQGNVARNIVYSRF